jgi:hypothetical protein
VADEETSANIPIATKSFCLMFSPAVLDLRERYFSPEELSNRIFMWSALTCQRFGKATRRRADSKMAATNRGLGKRRQVAALPKIILSTKRHVRI